MPWLNLHMPSLDWRQPWLWPSAFQSVACVCAAALSVLLLSPWWWQGWQAWDDARQAQASLMAQQEATQTLRKQTAQSQQAANPASVSLGDVSTLTHSAHQQGLHLSQLAVDKVQHSPALHALHVQELPVHIKVEGAWEGWLNWLAQWPIAAPGVTVSSLELKADPQGGISAQMWVVVPQFTAMHVTVEFVSPPFKQGASADPFSATDWATVQRAHTAQHPSYARLVAPELLHPREALEAYPRERLQYVGQVTSGGKVEALVKVLPAPGAKHDTSMTSVHRVRVGSRLGQDFGKLVAVQPDALWVRELVWAPTGEWQTRELRLPLYEAVP